jgi:hypothetical protein
MHVVGDPLKHTHTHTLNKNSDHFALPPAVGQEIPSFCGAVKLPSVFTTRNDTLTFQLTAENKIT